MSPSFLKLLDAWRRAQPENLSQVDAIRHLAARGRLAVPAVAEDVDQDG